MPTPGTRASGGRPRAPAAGADVRRWVCRSGHAPVLLGTYEPDGRVHIKVRDRYWHVVGRVEAVCPRCGRVHAFDHGEVSPEPAGPAAAAAAAGDDGA